MIPLPKANTIMLGTVRKDEFISQFDTSIYQIGHPSFVTESISWQDKLK